MSFSCYKTLLRFAKSKPEFNFENGLRLYSQKFVYVSSSPHDINQNLKKNAAYEATTYLERSSTKKKSFKLENPYKSYRNKTRQFRHTPHTSNSETVKLPLLENKSINSNSSAFFEKEVDKNENLKAELIINSDELNTSPVKNNNFDLSSNENNESSARIKIIKNSDGNVHLDLLSDEFDVDTFIEKFDKIPEPLDECKEDISDFGPPLAPTFNFAAYADKSELIQKFVKLGVELYKVERNMDHMRALLSVDMETQLPKYIQFLHDCGVPADKLGSVITTNPMIFREDMDDLKTRIRYLRAHEFDVQSIAKIVSANPTWLTWATKHIDERLGYFQDEFALSPSEVRFLATKQPKIVTYNYVHLCKNTHAVKEVMGFDKDEVKCLILSKPRIWIQSRNKIIDAFDYLHNVMKLSHKFLLSQPELLTSRKSRLQTRHEFLEELKKAQYDPKQPGYISPNTLLFFNDEDFCKSVAKVSLATYDLFLRTR